VFRLGILHSRESSIPSHLHLERSRPFFDFEFVVSLLARGYLFEILWEISIIAPTTEVSDEVKSADHKAQQLK
jgi:hypothetical protein